MTQNENIQTGQEVRFWYTNHRGEFDLRHVRIDTVWYGTTDWYPEPQMLVHGYDFHKEADRDFALIMCNFVLHRPPMPTDAFLSQLLETDPQDADMHTILSLWYQGDYVGAWEILKTVNHDH